MVLLLRNYSFSSCCYFVIGAVLIATAISSADVVDQQSVAHQVDNDEGNRNDGSRKSRQFFWPGSPPSAFFLPPPFHYPQYRPLHYPTAAGRIGDDEVDYRPLPSPSQLQVFDLLQDDDRPGQEEEETKRKYLSWNDRFSYEDDDEVVESRAKFSNYRPMSKKRPSAALNYPTMASVNGAAAVATGNGAGYFPLPLSSSSSWTKAANWFNMNNILYQSCTDPNGISGVCAPSFLCSGSNGRPSGSCSSSFASVCCINVVNSCGGRVTINNTYWQSPSAINSGTTCALTISLNPSLVEQPNAIAQVRLDFLSFAISQPNSETVCAVDSFNVAGTANTVPSICGDNPGQHMYLTVPSPVTDLQLSFIIGPSTLNRVWNIKISLLPCQANYLAPAECLQYFSSTSGTVMSFNWKDAVSLDANGNPLTRQLANQAYNICFRTELVSNQRASSLCLSPCTTTSAALPYSLSGATAGSSQLEAQESCNNDFIVFTNGYDPTLGNAAGSPATNQNDRFCGDVFAVQPTASAPSIAVCSQVKPFRLYYATNGDESKTATVDASGVGNQGFCFNYLEKTN